LGKIYGNNFQLGCWEDYIVNNIKPDIINLGGKMNTLPRANEAVISIEKFTEYALNPDKDKDKSIAFDLALGYNKNNAHKLIEQIKKNLIYYPAIKKENIGYGIRYEVIMDITGINGKTAKVLTGWIDDIKTGEIRLTTVHID